MGNWVWSFPEKGLKWPMATTLDAHVHKCTLIYTLTRTHKIRVGCEVLDSLVWNVRPSTMMWASSYRCALQPPCSPLWILFLCGIPRVFVSQQPPKSICVERSECNRLVSVQNWKVSVTELGRNISQVGFSSDWETGVSIAKPLQTLFKDIWARCGGARL